MIPEWLVNSVAIVSFLAGAVFGVMVLCGIGVYIVGYVRIRLQSAATRRWLYRHGRVM